MGGWDDEFGATELGHDGMTGIKASQFVVRHKCEVLTTCDFWSHDCSSPEVNVSLMTCCEVNDLSHPGRWGFNSRTWPVEWIDWRHQNYWLCWPYLWTRFIYLTFIQHYPNVLYKLKLANQAIPENVFRTRDFLVWAAGGNTCCASVLDVHTLQKTMPL